MALVPIGKDTFIDTDDLEQREYHYYRKAESLADKVPTAMHTAGQILRGKLTADQIDTLPEYEWLRTADATEKCHDCLYQGNCGEYGLGCSERRADYAGK